MTAIQGHLVTEIGTTAESLRNQYKEFPKERMDANQPFAIRAWRGISWLKRAEEASDLEGQFISLWIAFNAVYGQLQDDGLTAPDHGSWQAFLADIIRADKHDHLGRLLWDEQFTVLRLIDNQYLFRPFWLGQANFTEKLSKSRQRAMKAYAGRETLVVLQELFERLYVLRQQVFHGAATSGSKLNRESWNTIRSMRPHWGCGIPRQHVSVSGRFVPAMDSRPSGNLRFVPGSIKMPKGKVKWFNDTKGYGFIQMDGDTKDIFVHHTSIQAEGYRSLAEGDEVIFELAQGSKGLKAENVMVQQPACAAP